RPLPLHDALPISPPHRRDEDRSAPGSRWGRCISSPLEHMSVTEAPPGETQHHEPIRRPRASLTSALRSAEFDLRTLGMVGILIVIWVGFHIMSGGTFLTPRNLWNLSVQFAPVAIMATGMVLVIVTRNIDLSVGSMMEIGRASCR